jgi:hypothetical protein
MSKPQKHNVGRVLTPSEIEHVCFYSAMDIRYEILSDSHEWVFIDCAKAQSNDDVTMAIADLIQTYPGQSIRAIDMLTGRIVDMT